MSTFKQWSLCKILAVALCVLIAGEAHFALAAQANQQDPFETALAQAREAYFAAKYPEAKTILEKLIGDLAPIEGRDSFKGETFLLMGATYEMLKFKELAIKYFCRAKAVLGEGRSIEGLELKNFKYYKADCTGAAGTIAGSTAVRRRSFLGGLFGTLLFLSVIGAGAYLLWKYVIKKSDSGTSDTTYVYKSACFSTAWHVEIYSEWYGDTPGTVSFTPADTAPNPNENNGWTDSVTYTFSTSGGSLKSISLKMSVTVSGGDNGIRRDQAWVDNVSILDATNTFTQACSAPGSKDYNEIYQRTSTGSFVLKHTINLSGSNNVHSAVTVTKK
ncbi:MAG: hypothetical protein NTZ26_07155 [Candidatus Aminicenantes bacterium]|nr:hypothetical protein [Candidatus Aminicenantes bacterium]